MSLILVTFSNHILLLSVSLPGSTHYWTLKTTGTFLMTRWPTYVSPKSIISGPQGLYKDIIVGIQKLYTQHLDTFWWCHRVCSLFYALFLKSSLKRALLYNHDFPEEPLLCPNSIYIPRPWIKPAEHHLSFHSLPLQQPTLSFWMLQRRGCVCCVRSSSWQLPFLEPALPGYRSWQRHEDAAPETERYP